MGLKYLNNKGISLTEMLVAASLLLIVLSLGFQLYDYTTSTFIISEEKSMVQKDARHAADNITRELRYATSMDFITTYPNGGDGVNNYIIFDENNHKIILYTKTGSVKYITEQTIESLAFNTEFKPIFGEGNSKILLHFNVKSKLHNQSFELNSSVLLMNMTVNKTPGSDTIGIRYQRP